MTQKKEKLKISKLPISHSVLMSSLVLIMSIGGTYGGFYLYDSPKDIITPGPAYDTVLHTVTYVRDADTFIVDDTTIVRMLGVDGPETNACHGPESKQYLARLLLGKQVILQKDSTSSDDFGRLLRYVFIHNSDARADNMFVNQHLIKQGYAYSQHQGPDRRYESLLNVAMGDARKNKRGLHGICTNREDVLVEPQNDTCLIKGNYSPDTKKSIYFLPGCQNYTNLIMKQIDNDTYFCTEQEAQAAGFRIAGNCRSELTQ